MKKVNYDINVYDFSGIVSNIFNFSPLGKLHTEKDFSVLIKQSVNDTHTFQQSKYHQLYYDNFNLVNPTYIKLIENVIKPLYGGERVVYQKIPTFRIHFPNGVSVGMFHKDKDLRDDKWHESIKEDNFYLPVTNAYDTNTIWFESEEDKANYKPMVCDYGGLIQWDGTNLSHGNKINKTDDTRISIDFRVVTESNFKSNEDNSKNNKTVFTIGGYYDIL
jgi:ectoine hydroxylase-related dioxygenase (phytanoyl-CoA dioxygenase family)